MCQGHYCLLTLSATCNYNALVISENRKKWLMALFYYYRKAIPLNENEGIYIRNVQTGQVY